MKQMFESGYKRLINCIIPVTACNLKCPYCYIGQLNDFHHEIKSLPYSIAYIVHALRPDRIGRYCNINMCAMGETMLAPYIVEFTKQLTDLGHYVSIVTNGLITKRIEEICALPSRNTDHVFFKFSYHYTELQRQELFDTFNENVNRVKNSPCSYTIELTVNDASIPLIPQICKDSQQNFGAYCHVIESRDQTNSEYPRLTKLPTDVHLEKWHPFQSPLISFQDETYNVKRREFSYAGDWIWSFMLETGDCYTCFGGGHKLFNLYEDPDAFVHPVAIGEQCFEAHCYASHVLMTSGAIPSYQTPCYAQVRDRTCLDGSHWIKPSFQRFFGMQFRDCNHEYSHEKKLYINALMAMEYGDQSYVQPKELPNILSKALCKQGVTKVGIYGSGTQRQFIISLLKKQKKIRVAFWCSGTKDTSILTIQPDVSKGRVLFRGAVIDGQWYNPSDIVSEHEGWEYHQTENIFEAVIPRALVLEIPCGDLCKLTFETGPHCGCVTVKEDTKITMLDLKREKANLLGENLTLEMNKNFQCDALKSLYRLKHFSSSNTPMIPQVSITQKWPNIDTLIVTDFPNYHTILKELKQTRPNLRSIPLQDLIKC